MKVPVNDLVKLVREIAQDEIRKQLPAMVKECLTEAYLKKIVAEQAAPARKAGGRSLTEVLEDEIPQPENPVADDHAGIYHDKPKVSEAVSKLLSRDNPMAFVFEGVKPISNEPTPEVAPPVEKLAAAGFDFAKMNKLAKGMEKKARESRMMDTPDLKLREIEERRRALEVPVPKSE